MDELMKKMIEILNYMSDLIAHNKGLPVLIGVGLIVLSMLINLLPAWPVVSWFAETDLVLHLGCIVGLVGVLLGDALG